MGFAGTAQQGTVPAIPARPPISILCGVVVCSLAAIVVTPSFLIGLGPLRQSLTSENEITRQVAEMTVTVFRIVAASAAVFLVVVAVEWRRLRTSRLMQWIMSHEPLTTARHERFNRLWNGSLFIVLGCCLLCYVYLQFILPLLSEAWQKQIRREDGIIEVATTVLFAVSGVQAAILSVRLRHTKRYAVMLGLMALVFFVAVGEEISWGQRLLGLETIEALESINVQNENNIHNLFGYLADHIFIAAVFTYGAFLPFLCWVHPFWRKLFDMLGLPMSTCGLAAGFAIVSLWHDWTILEIVSTETNIRIAEIRELLTAICFVLLMYETSLLTGSNDEARSSHHNSSSKSALRRGPTRRRRTDRGKLHTQERP